MKAAVVTAAFAAGIAIAHAGHVQAMEMKDMSPSQMAKDAKPARHTARGTVKSVDIKAGSVTLDHEPVKRLNWPAATRVFKVHDAALMGKLAPGSTVEVEFDQRGKDYVITAVK